MDEPIKLCKDCRYFRAAGLSLGIGPAACAHPELMYWDVILGPSPVIARDARLLDKHCGWDARLFEQKLTFWQRITGKGAGK